MWTLCCSIIIKHWFSQPSAVSWINFVQGILQISKAHSWWSSKRDTGPLAASSDIWYRRNQSLGLTNISILHIINLRDSTWLKRPLQHQNLLLNFDLILLFHWKRSTFRILETIFKFVMLRVLSIELLWTILRYDFLSGSK